MPGGGKERGCVGWSVLEGGGRKFRSVEESLWRRRRMWREEVGRVRSVEGAGKGKERRLGEQGRKVNR